MRVSIKKKQVISDTPKSMLSLQKRIISVLDDQWNGRIDSSAIVCNDSTSLWQIVILFVAQTEIWLKKQYHLINNL